MGKIRATKTVIDNIEFDSQTEAEYYQYLKQQPNIIDIELQPEYELLKPFTVECTKCRGEGRLPSPKRPGKTIQCSKCEGDGWKQRQGWTYTADFKVTYDDGYTEVIDVKPASKMFLDKAFPNKKKMWEKKIGKELIIIKKIKGKFIRK